MSIRPKNAEFSGLGNGHYGMVMLALVGVFVGRAMADHTPEYRGKTITSGEDKLIALDVQITPSWCACFRGQCCYPLSAYLQ
jgi:K+-transporting ATPase A subunit